MTVYPFIEAEKVAERNVARTCGLLEVSRSAYYAQRDSAPTARQAQDAELSSYVRGATAYRLAAKPTTSCTGPAAAPPI